MFSPVRWSPFDKLIVSLIVLMVAFYVSTGLVKIFECMPREKSYDKSIPGTCINVPALLDVSGVFNTVTDIIILVLPIHAAWNLQLSKHKKILVVLVFTLGSWYVICSFFFLEIHTDSWKQRSHF